MDSKFLNAPPRKSGRIARLSDKSDTPPVRNAEMRSFTGRALPAVDPNKPMSEQPEVLGSLWKISDHQNFGVFRRLATEMNPEWQPSDWDWSWCDPLVASALSQCMNRRKAKQIFIPPSQAERRCGKDRTTIGRYYRDGRIAGFRHGGRLLIVLPSLIAFLNRDNRRFLETTDLSNESSLEERGVR